MKRRNLFFFQEQQLISSEEQRNCFQTTFQEFPLRSLTNDKLIFRGWGIISRWQLHLRWSALDLHTNLGFDIWQDSRGKNSGKDRNSHLKFPRRLQNSDWKRACQSMIWDVCVCNQMNALCGKTISLSMFIGELLSRFQSLVSATHSHQVFFPTHQC